MRRPISILCKRLKQASENGETVNMKYMYAAVTLDIMNDYCFARNPERVTLPDFGRKGFDNVDSFLKVSLLVSSISTLMPTPLIKVEHSHSLADAHHLFVPCKYSVC